ncbi:hypothetical protein RND81_03G086200 [Saponaria officinalis]|uniref:Uncharacterized protein n=1 Tax=Saponaria officinalis TaxID=3572 RepID=A0AAW1M624_SAPOF
MTGPLPNPYHIRMDPNERVSQHVANLRESIRIYNSVFPKFSLSPPYQANCLVETLPNIVPWSDIKEKYHDLIISGFPNYERYLYIGSVNSFWYPTFEDIAADLVTMEINNVVYLSDEESVSENDVVEEERDEEDYGSGYESGNEISTISLNGSSSDDEED